MRGTTKAEAGNKTKLKPTPIPSGMLSNPVLRGLMVGDPRSGNPPGRDGLPPIGGGGSDAGRDRRGG